MGWATRYYNIRYSPSLCSWFQVCKKQDDEHKQKMQLNTKQEMRKKIENNICSDSLTLYWTKPQPELTQLDAQTCNTPYKLSILGTVNHIVEYERKT